MNYIKYSELSTTFYILDRILVGIDIKKLSLVQKMELADIIVADNTLVKCRYSIEQLIDYFVGIK